jgi:tRNA threonylcarbamoyladenosine biosynthesis protein TsaB
MLVCFETSTARSSIAIAAQGQIITYQEFDQTQALASNFQALLRQSGCAIHDLTGVAVSAGPGSYTGLRIGAAFAKGLAFSLSLPLFAVDTLRLMAASIQSDLPKCPMMDARRMEVYTALLDSQLNFILSPLAWVVGESGFEPEFPVVYFGDGAAKCRQVLEPDKWIYAQGGLPSAKYMPELIQEVDLLYFEPFYLKNYQPKTSKSPLDMLKSKLT